MCNAFLKIYSKLSLLKTLKNKKKADVMWDVNDQMKKITAVIDCNDIKTATIIHICVRIRYTHQWLLGWRELIYVKDIELPWTYNVTYIIKAVWKISPSLSKMFKKIDKWFRWCKMFRIVRIVPSSNSHPDWVSNSGKWQCSFITNVILSLLAITLLNILNNPLSQNTGIDW